MTNSRDKGKRGELEVARILREHGYNARRGQQFAGNSGDADVVGLDGFYIEVKYREHVNLDESLEQVKRDSRAFMEKTDTAVTPIVIHRASRKHWKVTMLFEDFLEMIKNV